MDRTARLTFGIILWISAAGGSLELVGCSRNSGGDDAGAENSICNVGAPNCADGLVCDATTDGRAICAVPVEIVGSVLDLADDAAVVSARVLHLYGPQSMTVDARAMVTVARTCPRTRHAVVTVLARLPRTGKTAPSTASRRLSVSRCPPIR